MLGCLEATAIQASFRPSPTSYRQLVNNRWGDDETWARQVEFVGPWDWRLRRQQIDLVIAAKEQGYFFTDHSAGSRLLRAML